MPELIVHVLRHAHSSHVTPGERDHRRGLDERGEREVAAVRARLKREPVEVSRIVCSTALRARLTLAPLLSRLGNVPTHYDDDLYAMGMEAYETACVADGGRSPVLLVGHNPTIERFIERWCPDDRAAIASGIKPASWATLRLATDGDGGLREGRLVLLSRPL